MNKLANAPKANSEFVTSLLGIMAPDKAEEFPRFVMDFADGGKISDYVVGDHNSLQDRLQRVSRTTYYRIV